ncbi:MAG: LysR substrate-binding domain-containing protein [Pseudomonadales bacterium]|nr:LysR substrate-binding domain-containing protein [Pseudomonadales bacterium]NRA17960.1 LysR family transcriptional regulator [Oceanospirillaceae bacterium]
MAKKIDLRKLPPLKSLKGFEATARLLSVRGAAEELNLTHPAVSHQIQVIEKALAVKLFSRAGRNIRLTDAGHAYYLFVRQALEILIQGTEQVASFSTVPALRFQTYISLSIRWLAPRLHRFSMEQPDIDIQLSSCSPGWEFDEGNADIGLIYSTSALPNHLHWVDFFDSEFFPVCSPDLIKPANTQMSPQQLCQYPLLKVSGEEKYWNWEQWFTSVGSENKNYQSSIEVDTSAAAIEMAINGEGITLVSAALVTADLTSGRLIKPIDHSTRGNGKWGLICNKTALQDPRVEVFLNWLIAEKNASK